MKNKWIPTPLLWASERQELPVEPAVGPRRGGVLFSFLQVLRFLGLLIAVRISRRDPKEKAVRVRRFLEQRGGLWVKISQTLASRHDALPDVYCEELGKLFDSATAFPGDVARQVVEESLGCPLEEVFSEFSLTPIAAASIGQTHVARLRWTGKKVAVKVRRPQIEETFKRDLKLVKLLTGLMSRIPSMKHLHPRDMYGELEVMLLEELDFRVEATLIRDMRKSLKKHRVFAPRVFFRYCTRDVLVMTFVEGVLMSDFLKVAAEDPVRISQWLDENKINTKKLAKRIYLSCQRQVFEDNLFHGDLHPGNIMLLRKNRFALLDFGAVGTLDLTTRKQVMLYHRLVGEGDLTKAMLVLIHMSTPVPSIDLVRLVRRLVRLTQKSLRFMTVKGVSYEERIYSDATNQQLRLIGKAKIPVSWDFLRAQRTFTVLEMSLRQLDPKIEPMKLSHRYFKARDRRLERKAGGELRQLLTHIEQLTADASSLARDLADAKALAGRVWGLDLGGRIAAFVRGSMGVLRQAMVAGGLLLFGYVAARNNSSLIPESLKGIFISLEGYIPPLEPIVWIVIALALAGVYRIAGTIRRGFG